MSVRGSSPTNTALAASTFNRSSAARNADAAGLPLPSPYSVAHTTASTSSPTPSASTLRRWMCGTPFVSTPSCHFVRSVQRTATPQQPERRRMLANQVGAAMSPATPSSNRSQSACNSCPRWPLSARAEGRAGRRRAGAPAPLPVDTRPREIRCGRTRDRDTACRRGRRRWRAGHATR